MPERRYHPLTGGTAVWIFMSIEVLTFGMFLLAHAWGWRSEPQVFADSQSLLHVDSAVRGTALLLIGSFFAYQGVLQNAQDHRKQASAWLAAAAVAGALFTVNKILEYRSPELAGVSLSTNSFFFSYLFLTMLHLLHVMAGVGIMGWLSWRSRAGDYGAENPLTVQAAAVYWHLVDVVWVLVFPILYLMHP